MTVPALLARIRSASDAEMGLMLTPDDVITLDAELFRLTQGLDDMRRVCEFMRGEIADAQVEERAAVVAYFRAPGTSCDTGVLADDIDHGEHRRKVQS